MRIQHNIPAMNSYRNYTGNVSRVSKSLEKLSTGYRVNRAGDDAAGLAISEKMRIQMTGLEQAQTNARAGINLVQTAEGALTEVHDMLNRMYTLAEQSANGTYSDDVDREQLQKEIVSLRTEIDRIADATNYNGINLLDGSLSADAAATGSVADGGKVAYVSGDKAVVTSVEATKDKWATANEVKVAKNTALNIKYINDKGEVTEKSLVSSADNTMMSELIKADAELNSLFSAAADGKSISSRVAGSNAPRILEVKNGATAQAKSVADSVSGADAGLKITWGATAADPAAGEKVTIGDKTYEFVTNPGEATKGNVEVLVGDKLAGLAAALKNNGVTASVDDTAHTITITNLDQIAVDSKTPGVAVDSDVGVVYATAAEKGVYDFKAAANKAGTADSAQTLTVSILDENGKAKDIEVRYNSSSTDTTNFGSIMSALENDSEITKYFDVDTDNGKLTAKVAGSGGAVVTGLTTTDTGHTDSTDGVIAFDTTTPPKDAQKILDLTQKDADNSGAKIGAGSKVTVDGKTYEFVNDGQEASKGNTAVVVGADDTATVKNLYDKLKADGVEVTRKGTTQLVFSNTGKSDAANGEGGLRLQIGDTAEDFNMMTVSVNDMHTEAMKYTAAKDATGYMLEADGMTLADIDISSQEGASKAMAVIKAATNYVSDVRGSLGALQNRLDHTIKNLSVSEENITEAESTIRDTDVAKEMMNYTKNNILVQSAQAMLAQANQLPQGVLQLLG